MRERRRDCASESDEAVECEDMTGNSRGWSSRLDRGSEIVRSFTAF